MLLHQSLGKICRHEFGAVDAAAVWQIFDFLPLDAVVLGRPSSTLEKFDTVANGILTVAPTSVPKV